MSIFVIYDFDKIWEKVYKTFDEAVDHVTIVMDEYNQGYKSMEDWDGEWRPAQMEDEFTHKDSQGGVLVAYNQREKMGVFIKELTY